MRPAHPIRPRFTAGRGVLAIAAVTAGIAVPVATAGSSGATPAAVASSPSCHLGNGVQHVVELTFDNVHFFRDNPNVPSDLELMPTLYNFLKDNGTVLSNMHTPLIAHTAEDSLAIYSGLYGDRHGQPISNSYRTYQPDGTTQTDTSFTYWNSPVINNSTKAPSTTDTTPSMIYSPTVPAASTTTPQVAPEPWVAWNKAGCSVGAFSTANMVLENTGDIPTAFGGATPPLGAYANATSAFLGEAIHCGVGDSRCAGDAAAVTDTPPPSNDPGSASFKALFGHSSIQPFLDTFAHAPAQYRVADNAGNLVDLSNREIADYKGNVGFPGFSPTPDQTLAMMADMQEAGVPVTYGYIADMHEAKDWSYDCTTASATGFGKPLGPGDACYVENARLYDAAFAKFLNRLAADGITPRNTLFVVGAEENDQFAGANVGRANAPSDPANCDGVTVPCRYAVGQVGELEADLPALLANETGDTTAFDLEPQGAAVYVHGQPAVNDPQARQLERDFAKITGADPYSGNADEKIVDFQADATEQRILHLQTADPLRTPTDVVFPKPDYYFDTTYPKCGTTSTPASSCVSVYSSYAWNHGYYSPNIDITWTAFAGPGVERDGIDGPKPADSPAVHDPSGTGTVPQYSTKGTWADETDVRPTLLYLAGIHDDYVMDGRVVSEIVRGAGELKQTAELGACYKQLNASVGTFGTDTLKAATAALAGGSASDDSAFTQTDAALAALADARDALAGQMKTLLDAVEFGGTDADHKTVEHELDGCRSLLAKAHALA
jgi:hypothetical protein